MDIDIDFQDRNQALTLFKHRKALTLNHKTHSSGVYFHEIPHDPKTNVATIDFEQAELRGYFKIDFLNLSLYKGVKSEEHLLRLMETEPMWELLENQQITDMLFHLNGHFDILQKVKPKSVEQLAVVLALIRPAKRYLLDEPWEKIMAEIWIKTSKDNEVNTGKKGFAFKKAHAFSYAMAIIVQMNLLCEATFG